MPLLTKFRVSLGFHSFFPNALFLFQDPFQDMALYGLPLFLRLSLVLMTSMILGSTAQVFCIIIWICLIIFHLVRPAFWVLERKTTKVKYYSHNIISMIL